jgi:hypothetical protein
MATFISSYWGKPELVSRFQQYYFCFFPQVRRGWDDKRNWIESKRAANAGEEDSQNFTKNDLIARSSDDHSSGRSGFLIEITAPPAYFLSWLKNQSNVLVLSACLADSCPPEDDVTERFC